MIKLSKAQKDRFIAEKLSLVSIHLPFISAEKIRKYFADELEDILELSSDKVSKARAKFFDLSFVESSDYRETFIDLGDERGLILGVRFRGLDVSQCFVSAWPNYRIGTVAEVEEVKSIAKEVFRKFDLRWLSLSFDPRTTWEGLSYFIDLITVVGETKALQGRNLEDSDFFLDQVFDIDFYDRYSKEYKILHEEIPSFKNVVTKETISDLESSAEDSLLYKIMLGGEQVGVISGRREQKYGVRAICINEKLLFKDYRGKGNSLSCQQQFIEQLDGDEDILVWGTILASNKPSLKSALRTGRKAIEADFFFDL